MSGIQYKIEQVDGLKIFYREAGHTSHPGLLLLHGHASGSHTFRNIIPELSKHFHVVAPDYPGFGNSDRPKDYEYNFVNIANTFDKFTEQIGLSKFNVYTFDFGGPVGFLMAEKHPERILGIFSQSGNAYDEGLSPAFGAIRKLWADPKNQANLDAVGHLFSDEGIVGAYKLGVGEHLHPHISPDAANLDRYYTGRPGMVDIQYALLIDYENVVKRYPKFQEYLREHKPKVVAVWGKNDPFFAVPGAEAFKRDLPDADVTIIEDGAHFMNESHPHEIIKGLKKLL